MLCAEDIAGISLPGYRSAGFSVTDRTLWLRRVHLRGRNNILKRFPVHGAAFNLSLILRKLLGVGKPGSYRGFVCSFLRFCEAYFRGPMRFGTGLVGCV
jgi:hypothetical protein